MKVAHLLDPGQGGQVGGGLDIDGDPLTYTTRWSVNGREIGTFETIDSAYFVTGQRVSCTLVPFDGEASGEPVTSGFVEVLNTASSVASVAIDPAGAKTGDLLSTVQSGAVDLDGDLIAYTYAWTVGGASVSTSPTLSATAHKRGDLVGVAVTATDGTDTFTAGVSATATVTNRDGQVQKANGTWIDVHYEACGTGTSGNATQAKAACTAIGEKLVSHASDGSSSVYSLGATASCYYVTGYLTTDATRPSGECLVGISNLDWSSGSCCSNTLWHGNTLDFGAAGKVFGYGQSGYSGYNPSDPNVTGNQWGCHSATTPAGVLTGCTKLMVACTK